LARAYNIILYLKSVAVSPWQAALEEELELGGGTRCSNELVECPWEWELLVTTCSRWLERENPYCFHHSQISARKSVKGPREEGAKRKRAVDEDEK
jgi:hypothetical protein